MAIGTKPANGPGHFLMTLSHPVLWLGLLGLPFMLAAARTRRARRTPWRASPCSCGPSCCSSAA